MVHPERNLSDIYVRDENKEQHKEQKDNILKKIYALQFHMKCFAVSYVLQSYDHS